MKKPGLQKEQTFSQEEITEMRREAGKWLKTLREARSYSQSELQRLIVPHLRTKYVSLIEHGRQIVMPEDMEAWARALGVEPEYIARNLLKFYNPLVYQFIFDEH
ncbi:helix-turn-helix domain-containing protein [Methylobacterium sp. Leaf99]|uniref:helix-turn-helix domain-containing protein n=1 Tax=Methylobacterium sp. Leaf99 TaxID=1736251 RepID=UPI0009ECB378|nr:helix-turn-helix transcriptional regulator [Methylobacterium sp. Leaf99]